MSTERYGCDDWDRRWHDKAEEADWQPDPWLVRALPLLIPGAALDVACGMGRHALFLAERGFSVTAVDFSPVALDLLRQQARRCDLSLAPVQLDLEQSGVLPAGPFLVGLNFFYLYRPALQQMMARITPGGFAVVRTFCRRGEDRFGPVNPVISLLPNELLETFSGWDVLLYEEGLEPSKKGGSLAGIVARKKE